MTARQKTNSERHLHVSDPVPESSCDWHAHRERAAQMSVETVRADATGALVRVVGELDMGTAAPLWAVLQSHLAFGRRFLRLDVRGLRFLDATALSGITVVHADALQARGTLILTGVQSVVGRVLSLTGLDDVLFIGGPRSDDDVDLDLDHDPSHGARASADTTRLTVAS